MNAEINLQKTFSQYSNSISGFVLKILMVALNICQIKTFKACIL